VVVNTCRAISQTFAGLSCNCICRSLRTLCRQARWRYLPCPKPLPYCSALTGHPASPLPAIKRAPRLPAATGGERASRYGTTGASFCVHLDLSPYVLFRSVLGHDVSAISLQRRRRGLYLLLCRTRHGRILPVAWRRKSVISSHYLLLRRRLGPVAFAGAYPAMPCVRQRLTSLRCSRHDNHVTGRAAATVPWRAGILPVGDRPTSAGWTYDKRVTGIPWNFARTGCGCRPARRALYLWCCRTIFIALPRLAGSGDTAARASNQP